MESRDGETQAAGASPKETNRQETSPQETNPEETNCATPDQALTDLIPNWAPTAEVTLDMVGKTRTISCLIDKAALTQMR